MWGQKILRAADKTLNVAIWCLVLILFLYSGLGLWDTYCIYRNAGNSELVYQYKPSGKGDALSFSELQKMNKDVCAWLTVDGTSIDYPVVQGESNMEYINKDVEGKFSLSGSLFLDYRNDQKFQDFYSLIYGHHMEGDIMFGSLPSFQEAEFFDSHTTAELSTPEDKQAIEIFACVHTDAYDSIIFAPEYQDEDSKALLLNHIKEKAVQYRSMDLTKNDRIIGFSTCYDTTTNGRIIVFGKIKSK